MNQGSTGKGPSVAELQKMVREKRQVEMILLTGQKIRGALKWFDEQAYCIVLDDGESITLLRSAIIGYRLVPGTAAGAPRPAAQAAPPPPQE
ncbi:MAG: RNA chaperone Hfq [Candidatus Obscuribacterales bacterium]|nr:RNA chaperone Hfq [Candidatus Obscuribacterales bacterium]